LSLEYIDAFNKSQFQ